MDYPKTPILEFVASLGNLKIQVLDLPGAGISGIGLFLVRVLSS